MMGGERGEKAVPVHSNYHGTGRVENTNNVIKMIIH